MNGNLGDKRHGRGFLNIFYRVCLTRPQNGLILYRANRVHYIRRAHGKCRIRSRGGRLTRLTQYWRVRDKAWAFVREFGITRFLQELDYRFVNDYHDRRLGIETNGMVRLVDIGIDREDSVEYTPIGYSAIHHALKYIPIPAANVSFLDFGSGKGRVIAVAATHPFRKVLGVEISAHLNRIAKTNIDRLRHRRAKQVEVIQSDAADFVVPDDINVVFLFNPFFGKTLKKVVDNILASYTARPRPVYIIFFNKIHFERLIKDAGYGRIRPIHHMHFYPSYSCGIYEIGNEPGIAGTGP